MAKAKKTEPESEPQPDQNDYGQRIDALEYAVDGLQESADGLQKDVTNLSGEVKEISDKIDTIVDLIEAAGEAPAPRPAAQQPAVEEQPEVPNNMSPYSRPLPINEEDLRLALFAMRRDQGGGGDPEDPLLEQLLQATANVTSPLTLRKIVLQQRFPGGQTQKNLAIVRSTIAANGGGAHMRFHKDLPPTILYEIYVDKISHENNDDDVQSNIKNKINDLSEADIREFAAQKYKVVGEALYQDRIIATIEKLGGQPDLDEVADVYEVMNSRRVALDSSQFTTEVAKALETARHERAYRRFFQNGDAVQDDLRKPLNRRQMRRAIRQLDAIGLDPEAANDNHWGRIALGMSNGGGNDRDALSLAGFGGGGNGQFDYFDFDPNFPDFDTDYSTGLIAENISTAADLYYIHQFGRMGIFDVVRKVGQRFFDDVNLGRSDTASKLYRYIKLMPVRFPEEDWAQITNSIFEEGMFKSLMGRMVESLIEYTEARNAGLFFLNAGQSDRAGTAQSRSAVIRAVQNLQRYLTDSGGGINHFVKSEVGAQLMECFDILSSEDLGRYYGGSFRSGMFAIIEQEGRGPNGEAPPVDRNTTLAVYGRRILNWLADNTANSAILTDTDLDELIEHVDQWLSAYRRPTMEPDWLDDDDSYYDEEDEADEMIEETMRDAVGEEEMDILSEI